MTVHAKITGVGSYLPGGAVTNSDLVALGVDTSDEWICGRTGIRSRHFAGAGELTSDMALHASRKALEMAAVNAGDIDLIVLATSTSDHVFPSTACILQSKLGNHGATAFDIQAVCTGFIYAISIAEKFIRSGSHKRALVVGSESFSRLLDWKDRTTCVLFGDGAGAVVLEASDRAGIVATALHADGDYAGILHVKGQVVGGDLLGDPYLRMDGQAVFRFAVRALADVASEVCSMAGVAPDGIDWLVPHQANLRIIEGTAKKMGLPMEKVIVTVDRHGNTSAASVPLALDEGVRSGRIKRGDTVLLEGVGGGFTWGAVLLEF